MSEKGLKRGQPITFRIPSDTSDHILKQLQRIKETERRNFSSKIAEFVIYGVNDSLSKHREAITIPLPKGLTKEQRDWLKHEHSEALLGNIVYQLLSNPIRTASILASLNSSALEIDDALYLQEETAAEEDVENEWNSVSAQPHTNNAEEQREVPFRDDDLDNLDWDNIKIDVNSPIEEDEVEEDPLGDFLAQMNK
ncbi:hypothetical protein [Lederbergia citrea]|uniref:Uncharacterized protein n=1 Tax=Lederbergia citrea TaxID=2833581 RepID=A0A942UPI3_9BACI|nr:hypothetical protein [Lederbergia citrea]MBS4177825.1 hypothetical protein [Lederbergia citrea]MBS4223657.1 hypothetical protein [Lederbergia citrea]